MQITSWRSSMARTFTGVERISPETRPGTDNTREPQRLIPHRVNRATNGLKM